MVKVGDKVRVGGSAATVTGTWGQGRHVAWQLDDGRQVLDLHKHIESGVAQLLEEAPAAPVAPAPEPVVEEEPEPELEEEEPEPEEEEDEDEEEVVEDSRTSPDWRLDLEDDQVD